MTFLRKRLLAGVIAGAIMIAGTVGVYAAETEGQEQAQKMDINVLAKDIADQYDVNEKEVLKALKDDRSLDDIYYAAIFSKVSGKSFQQVFAMKSDWFDVMQKLGITREQYENAVLDLMVEDISERASVDKATVRKLLDERYNPRDIRIAGRLAKAANKNVKDVLDMKKINQRWTDVAEQLGVDKNLVRPRTPGEEAEDSAAEK